MERVSKTLDGLNAYFLANTKDTSDLSKLMDQYKNDRNAFNRDFYSVTLYQLQENQITTLLNTLGVPKYQHGRYVNQRITVYNFLKELDALKQSPPLKNTVAFIDQHHVARWKVLALWIAFLSACSIAPFWIYGLTAIEQFVTTASVIATAGLGYSFAIALYTLFEYTAPEGSPSYTWYQLFKDNFFALLNSAFVVSAWAILLTAAASDPVTTLLFIGAELVFVAEEVWHLIKMAYHKNLMIDQPKLSEKQQQARESADFDKRKHDVYIKLAAGVLMTVIIATWCLVPGGFIVPVICMASIGIIKATTLWAIWQNEARIQAKLLTQFKALEDADALEISNPTQQQSVSNSNEMTPSLNRSVHSVRPRSISEPIPYSAIASKQSLFKPKTIKIDSFAHGEQENTNVLAVK